MSGRVIKAIEAPGLRAILPEIGVWADALRQAKGELATKLADDSCKDCRQKVANDFGRWLADFHARFSRWCVENPTQARVFQEFLNADDS